MQQPALPLAPGYIGLGAYSKSHVDAFSFLSNNAALAQLPHTSAGITGERRFLMKELGAYTAALGIILPSGRFGFNFLYAGFAAFGQMQTGLAYARSLGTRMDLGLRINYHRFRIAGYGASSALSVESGIILHLPGSLHVGIATCTPAIGKFGAGRTESLPSVFKWGLGYEASPVAYISTEIIKETNEPVNVRAGLQYLVLSKLILHAGVSTASSSIWTGIGFSNELLRIDVAATFHPDLGISPGLLVLFHAKKRQPKLVEAE